MRGRPTVRLVLSDAERDGLRTLIRRGSTAQALAVRARIVLACADGASNVEVAAALGVSPQTVGKWRERFVRYRLDGLADRPRPGPPRTIRERQVAEVVHRTLREPPAGGAARWSTRSMAAATGLSQATVSRIWRAFGLRGERVRAWRMISGDPGFADRVRDVAGLFLDPPVRLFGLYVDAALPRATAPAPDCRDRSAAPALSALDAAADLMGERRGGGHRRLAGFLRAVEAAAPDTWHVHLLSDQPIASGLGAAALHGWLAAHPRVHLDVGPRGPVWSGLARRWLSSISRCRLAGWPPGRLAELDAELAAWLAGWPAARRPFAWVRRDDFVDGLPTRWQGVQDI